MKTPERMEWERLKREATKEAKRKAREDCARHVAAQEREAAKVASGKRLVTSVGRLSI
jgi:hypothetical protein